MISLKRFQPNSQGGFVKKNDKINIPLLLQLDEFEMIPNTLPQKGQSHKGTYELISVACHSGNLRGGHYYSVLKNSDRWFQVNDDTILPIEDIHKATRLMDTSAYMLFYTIL